MACSTLLQGYISSYLKLLQKLQAVTKKTKGQKVTFRGKDFINNEVEKKRKRGLERKHAEK